LTLPGQLVTAITHPSLRGVVVLEGSEVIAAYDLCDWNETT